jgi:signal transduction histidine kinase
VLHEIRQPLAAAFAQAELTRSLPGIPEDVQHHLGQLIQLLQEVSGAARSALAANETNGSATTGWTDLEEVLDSVLATFRLTWSGQLSRRGSAVGLLVSGPRVVLRRCLVNVVDNAVRAAGPDGAVTVTVRRTTERVWVVVDDDGPGFGPTPEGTGLGLASTRAALDAVGGTVSVGVPSSGPGARVVLSLPFSDHRFVERSTCAAG